MRPTRRTRRPQTLAALAVLLGMGLALAGSTFSAAGPGASLAMAGYQSRSTQGDPASVTVVDASASSVPQTFPPAVHIAGGGPLAGRATVRLDIAGVLLDAYRSAAGGVPTSCHLPVSLLAAIGQVESGSLVGHPLDAQHRTSVLGPVLDGHGFAALPDTDHGRWDGDTTWDRAVGPMQFVPSTWARFGVDGDGDGAADPQDLEDATAATAAYLCYGGRDLSRPADLRSAVLSYNHSKAYLQLVLTYQERYAALGLDSGRLVTGSPTSIAVTATPIGELDGWSRTRPDATDTRRDGAQPGQAQSPRAHGSSRPATSGAGVTASADQPSGAAGGTGPEPSGTSASDPAPGQPAPTTAGPEPTGTGTSEPGPDGSGSGSAQPGDPSGCPPAEPAPGDTSSTGTASADPTPADGTDAGADSTSPCDGCTGAEQPSEQPSATPSDGPSPAQECTDAPEQTSPTP